MEDLNSPAAVMIEFTARREPATGIDLGRRKETSEIGVGRHPDIWPKKSQDMSFRLILEEAIITEATKSRPGSCARVFV